MPLDLELVDVSKEFPGVLANDSVSLKIKPRTIYGIIGENGAGKTTLMNILYGLYRPDSGHIRINDESVRINNPATAIQLGIGMVHQHFMLVPSLTVLENIILGQASSGIFLDFKSSVNKLNELLEMYHLDCDLNARVYTLSVGMKQKVEIIKALYKGADLLIFDEPTGVLTPQEVKELFKILWKLRDEGKTIIMVTHKLGEIMSITESVFVMKKGRLVGEIETRQASEAILAKMMVGRDVTFSIDKPDADPKHTVLEVRNLKIMGQHGLNAVDNISFQIRSGEIVGIAGVEGNGQSELIECLAGLRPIQAGDIRFSGKVINTFTPRERRELGLSHIPEDRMSRGIAVQGNVQENVIAGRHYRSPLASKGILLLKRVRTLCHELIGKYLIKTPGLNIKIGNLSGGNIQKLIIARELDSNPEMMIIAHPSRGVDIGATEFIHQKILELRKSGTAILLISSELSEVIDLSDRILVMYRGRINGECDPKNVTEEELGLLMAGADGTAHKGVQ